MKTILLIEDRTEIRENTAELLELEGYRVLEAENGRRGLELVARQHPDVILCDIMMPEKNGYEVFTELKNNPETAGIPFIFLTASVERSEVEKGYGMGANGYVRKPFVRHELLDALRHALYPGAVNQQGSESRNS